MTKTLLKILLTVVATAFIGFGATACDTEMDNEPEPGIAVPTSNAMDTPTEEVLDMPPAGTPVKNR